MTATPRLASATIASIARLAAGARREIAAGSRGPWIVAFSGGPDSTALAFALAAAEPPLPVEIHLLHVEHGLDSGSAERAERARALAKRLARPFLLERRTVREERRPGENLEAAARRVRYAALEAARERLGADRILTAHHRDDQIETVLLRLLSGSGIFGLSGVQERRGALWRPALNLARAELHQVLAGSGLEPIEDPTNLDLDRDRNRIRHRLLPHLRATEPEIDEALARLAATATRARSKLAQRIEENYELHSSSEGAELSATALAHHPHVLNLFAFQLLEERAGYAKPSSTRARSEVIRQVLETESAEMIAFGGRRLRRRPGGRVALAGASAGAGETGPFSYTLPVPGEVAVPELGGVMRLTRCAVEPWMLGGESNRAALVLPEPLPETVEIRNRRSGDRLRPLGGPGMRSLKELLIDRKVPRAERDRIPLLVVGGRIAWVPGVTIDDACRLRGGAERGASACWVAEWFPDRKPPAARSTFKRAEITRPEDEDT